MKRPARRYDWARVRTAGGNVPPVVYVSTPSESMSLNVYRDGSAWRYVVIAFSADGSHVLKSSTGATMHEAMIYAEDAIGRIGHPQQELFPMKGGHDATDEPSDLPF